MIQKSRVRLTLVGAIMVTAIAGPLWNPVLWAPSIVLFLIGAYLLLWGTIGRGRWCRACKKFGVS
jgi:hypothetical protein